MTGRVYLAGPDVFLRDPEARAARLKAICARHGLSGVSPLDALADEDTAWSALPEWRRIALRNEAHIRGCDAVIANLTPFRGPSADAGTVYEVGFARALGRPVFAYSNCAARFAQRTLAFITTHGGAMGGPVGVWRDTDGMLVEAFGCADNLMVEAAVAALVLPEIEPDDRWADMATFETCVRRAARYLSGAGCLPGDMPGDMPGEVPGDGPGDVPGDVPGNGPGDVPGNGRPPR